MATQSNQNVKYLLGDETNTLVDISAYVLSCPIPLSAADANQTTFAASGGNVTETHRRGAVSCQIKVECLFDPTLVNMLQRILGSNTGSTFQALHGNNAPPVYGDPLFQMSAGLFDLDFTYGFGADAKVSLDLRPIDGGSIVPNWYNV